MYTKNESRRERRRYQRYYAKASHQKEYIIQVGNWLGYTWKQMQDRFIYPGVNPHSFCTCRVVFRKGRWWIDEIPYAWNVSELLSELIRVKNMVRRCPDIAYRAEAKKWYRGKIFRARVLVQKSKIRQTVSLLNFKK